MSRKVQLLVGFLVLTTLLAGWQLLGLLRFPTTLANSQGSESSLFPPPDNDSDRDGLVDVEESYWNTDFQNPDTDGDGFKDGEEVASGHDPLVPGPNDLLLLDSVTEQMNELVVAGLYEGSLRPSNEKFDATLDQIADAVVDASAPQKTLQYTLTVVPATSASVQRYREYMRSTLTTLGTTITPGSGGGDSFHAVFAPVQGRIEELLRQLSGQPVPKTYQALHERFVAALSDLLNHYRSIVDSEKDPLRQTSLMGSLAELLDERLPEIVEAYGSLLHYD